VTRFDSEPAVVAAFAWSRDGKTFAVTHARYNDADVVLFSSFRYARPRDQKGAYTDFLTLWKHADPDIPILKEAKVEYAKLQ
jgi:hypothetical protein